MKNFIYSLVAAAAIMMVGCEDPEPLVIDVTDVAVSPTTLTLEVDETRTLSVVVTPSDTDDPEVSWSSDTPSVATVTDSGEVTAVGTGFATITATADGGRTANCRVTVFSVTANGMIDGLSWQLTSDSTLTISGKGAMPDFGYDNMFEDGNYDAWRIYLGKIKTLVITEGVTSIGVGAFSGCRNLQSITIPNSVTSIRRAAFSGCTSLTSIDIPAGVTSIGAWTFYGCTGLESIEIPDSVTSIGIEAFYGCTGLVSIEIPDGVTSIGYRAFYGCTGLKDVTIMSATPPILELANFTANNDTLHVPQGSLAAYENNQYWRAEFTNIIEQQ